MLKCAAIGVAGRHLPKQYESKDPLHDHRQQIKKPDLNSQKSSKKEPTAIPTSKPKKKEVLNVQTKSALQPPKKAENKAAGKRPELFDAFKERVEKKYPFDEDVEEIFGAPLANGKLTLPDRKRLGDVGKTKYP
ncbi:hypothetical protein MRB53_002215 [Persea americana]|uniref:Uncharacterized protein n=1 Tax=Persea americana TaxID=3435 RepID=A0ACC2MTV2_PERAE|nr:hypothetical protein MRB53_002215 [Persea americana]